MVTLHYLQQAFLNLIKEFAFSKRALYKFPEEFCIQNENNPDRNISCVPLKNRYVILAGSQSMQYQSILGTGTLGLEIGALDQTRGEIPNFPIFKSS